MKKDKRKVEPVSNTGEMIPSMYNWMTHDEQQKIANKLATVTKKDKEK